MSMTPRESLLELCSDHFHGLISTDTYRKRRAELLDDAILGRQPDSAVDVEVAPARPNPVAPERPSRPEPAAALPREPMADAARAAARPFPVQWVGAGVAAMALVGMLAWWLTDSAPEPIEAAAVSEAEVPVTPTAESAAIPLDDSGDFVSRFVATDVWDEVTLSEFLFEWDLLTDAQREAARASAAFRSLDERLKGRLLELRALADPGVPASVDRVQLVAGFARELGLNPDVGTAPAPAQTAALATPTPGSLADAEIVTAANSPATQGATAPATASGPGARSEAPAEATPQEPAPSSQPVAGSATQPVHPVASVADAVAAAPPQPVVEPAPSAPADVPVEKIAGEAAGVATTAPVERVAIASARPCRKEVAAVVPLPPANRRSCFDNIAADLRGPLLLILPPGQFTQGSNEEKSASPAHAVTIPEAFALSVFETSVAEFRAFCEATRRACTHLPTGQDDFPVVGVTWHDAKDYAAWLAQETGARYRLPSEAEWEYAARAGTTTRYPFGDEVNQAQAVYASGGITGPLPRSKSVVPNEFGLRHMVGNVAEWVEDGWVAGHVGAPGDGSARVADGDERVVRGGAFNDPKNEITSASRRVGNARSADGETGFRVLREL